MKKISAVCTLLFTGFVWGHEGVQHGAGDEIHPRLEVIQAGPGDRFRITVAQLPDAPLEGQATQFLIKAEQKIEGGDALLGETLPFEGELEASFKGPGKSEVASLKKEEEPGIYRLEYSFNESGEWQLLIKLASGADEVSASVPVRIKPVPRNWTLLLLQGCIAFAAIGFAVHRALVSAPRSTAIVPSLISLIIGGGALIGLRQLWPPPFEVSGNVLEVGALLQQEQEQPVLLEEEPQSVSSSGSVDAYVSPTAAFSGIVVHATDRIAEVRSPLAGAVVYKGKVPTVGDRVRSGQVLAHIQNKFNVHDYSHLFNQRWDLVKVVLRAKETQVRAEAAYERAAYLLELGTISKREFGAAELALNTANEALKEAEERLALHDKQIAQTDLKETEVVAPIDGQISRATYSLGQVIYEGDPIFQIVDPSVVWVEVNVLPRDVSRLQGKSQVTLRSHAFPEKSFRGRLLRVRADADPVSKALRYVYEVRNKEYWLKPGMLLDVEVGGKTEGTQIATAGDHSGPVGGGN
ncbi:MAG: efflux RND transporter periplasmic adaptor subunit [Acidobacteria bacterium]|nr:efflux RND transporter periplasmic adaptor subunit [Acidobacteriota bacterium]